MTEKKSLVEEAILQMKNLEEVVTENAKGILESTMKQEIKELVKESLKEQDDEEVDDEDEDMDIEDDDMDIEDDDMDIEDDDMDIEDDDMDIEDDDMSEPNMEVDTIDLTKQPTSEVLKVFKLLSPEDEIVVTKDTMGNINLKDNETNKEYMIVSEGMDEYDEFDEMYHSNDMMEMDDEMDMMEMDDEMDMMEMDDEMDMMEMNDMYSKEEMYEMDDMEEPIYEIEMDSDDEDSDIQSIFKDVFGEEEEMDDEEFFLDVEESLYEAKKSMKPKGIGMGSASKFKYPKTPNQEGGFKENMKQGTRGVGMGKVKKDIYKSDSPSFDGEFSKKPTKSKETKVGMMTPKKMETKEAARTYGNGSKSGRGLRKGITPNRNLTFESIDSQELDLLREKNEEYRKALNIFRTKLNEVATFNSNLAYATRLFTEHSTSKQEKINILKRFDGIETLKESKNLYKIIKDELTTTKTSQITESIERTIEKTPSTGSAINLIESKTYENPQFLRMKDLMSKLK